MGNSDDHVPKPSGAFRLFAEALGKVNLAAGGALSIIASVLVAKFLPGGSVPLWFVTLICLLAAMGAIALLLALLRSVQQARELKEALDQRKPMTAVVSIVTPYPPYSQCRCVLIVKWSASAALPIGTGVTVSVAESHLERPLGFGTVRMVQADGNAVVTLDATHPGVDDHIKKLLDRSTGDALLERIRLGAQVSFQHLETMRSPGAPTPEVTPTSGAPTTATPTPPPAGENG